MDGLGWDVEDSFLISNSNSSSIYGDHIFINPTQQLQESEPSNHVNPVSNVGVLEMVDSQPVPASDFDMLWCSSPLLNSSAASVSDIGQAVHSQVLINGGATSSLESIDCLLSATNSNTDNTSVEDDDGISMIFSDCKNLWNFVATSSGESEKNNGSNTGHDRVISSKSGSSKRSINGEFKVGLNRGYLADSSGFKLVHENPPKAKKARSEKAVPSSSNINFQQPSSSSVSSSIDEPDQEAIAQMKEMIYRAAAFRPVNLGMEAGERPKRKNVRISTDPQTVAARQRRERISERIRVLQKLVPGGNKMDTASMLDEAANYLKFLRSQVKALENLGYPMTPFTSLPLNQSFPMQTHNCLLLNRNPVHHP